MIETRRRLLERRDRADYRATSSPEIYEVWIELRESDWQRIEALLRDLAKGDLAKRKTWKLRARAREIVGEEGV